MAPELVTSIYTPFAVDAMFAALLAMENLAQQGHSSEEIRGQLLLDELYRMDFTGVSGSVSVNAVGDRVLDFELWNVQGDAIELVGGWSKTGITYTADPIQMDGTTNP